MDFRLEILFRVLNRLAFAEIMKFPGKHRHGDMLRLGKGAKKLASLAIGLYPISCCYKNI